MQGCRPSTSSEAIFDPTLSKPNRAATRHAGPADPPDPPVGLSTRLRHQPGHSPQLRRHSAGRYWLALSRAAPPRAAEVDRRRLDTVRKQAARARLPPDRCRQKTSLIRTFALGTAF